MKKGIQDSQPPKSYKTPHLLVKGFFLNQSTLQHCRTYHRLTFGIPLEVCALHLLGLPFRLQIFHIDKEIIFIFNIL